MKIEKIINPAMRIVPLACLGMCIAFGIWGIHTGVLTSQDRLTQLISAWGIWAPLLFVFVQIVQVVIPILPGGVSCLIGVLLFGPIWGFAYNYAGCCLGSMAAFGIAKYYGKPILRTMFANSLIEKYNRWTSEKGRFATFFALAIFFPVAPDDFLCYLAGTTEMQWKTFNLIIWLCKPCSIALYSFILYTGWGQLLQWLS
ncbi:TVP38/TMEM64 family protein [uncultured Allofournierella sp.]|uniref:TVP38/TMEM64 family protein n=1 Tax=uncultured Allofournierella sp. TaxID=1940258 RepID=UPI0037501696